MMTLVRSRMAAVVSVAAILCGATALHLSAADEQDKAAAAGAKAAGAASSGTGRFYEMRTYHCPEGKLEDLHNRFRNHTNRLFKKHGIEMIGYWTPADAPESKNTLVFILAYPSRAEREKRWNAFASDPEWKKAAAESEKNGRLVAKVDQLYMNPTDYSPSK